MICNSSILQPMVLCINRVSNFLPPRFTRKFLWKFICKPDHIWKQIRIYLITHAYPTSPLPKMSVSLAYWRLVSEMDEHPGRPSNSCALLAFSNILLGSFATSMKIKGERGSSCLNPLLQTISFPAFPLVIIYTLADLNHLVIHICHRWLKPLARSTSSILSQSTIS